MYNLDPEKTAKAILKTVRISPQKANLVMQSIRGKSVDKALNELAFSKRRIANDIKKLVLSAIANAENNHELDVDRLYVAEASVGKAIVMKRWRPRARGRVGRIMKPFSHLRVVVREREVTE
jgi:large subunit ribosomal protein L22